MIALALQQTTAAARFDHAPSIFVTVSPESRRLASLGTTMLIVGTVIFVGVCAIMCWSLWRRRHAHGSEVTLTANENGWVLGGGLAMPVLVLAAVFVMSLGSMHAAADRPMDGDEILVIGHQWWWEVRYPHDSVTSANEIHLAVGRPTHVRLRSNDVIHSLWVPNLNGKVDLVPGQENMLLLRADSAGVYRGECAEYCGMQHGHMALSVVAQPADSLTQWIVRQKLPAPLTSDTAAITGQAAFKNGTCGFCHTIRGTDAQGMVGPDLTHVGSRLTIAGGMLQNTAGNLTGWIERPDLVKPGTKMPAIAMPAPQLVALVNYLESLK